MLRRTRRREAPPTTAAPGSLESRLTALLPAGATANDALVQRLSSCVHPALYLAQCPADEQAALGPDAAVEDVLAHWVDHGAAAGRRVCALFNPQWYADRLAEHGVAAPAEGTALFLHWLTDGWERRIVPTPLFDEDFYRARHDDLAEERWGFAHFVRSGCYAASRQAGPFARNYGSVVPPRARQRHEPVLLATFLRDASAYDLATTSWLEESVLAMRDKLARLDSPVMRDMVAKAVALQPLVAAPAERWVSWPARSHPVLVAADAIERLRREIGVTEVDSLVIAPGPTPLAASVARELRRLEPDGSVLVVGTDGAPAEGTVDGVRHVDASAAYRNVAHGHRPTALLDVVRGLAPRRVVVSADSRLGWTLLTAFGNALHRQTSLAAALDPAVARDFPVRDFEETIDLLDWMLIEDDAVRDGLVERYLLTPDVARRLITAPERIGEALGLPPRQERA